MVLGEARSAIQPTLCSTSYRSDPRSCRRSCRTQRIRCEAQPEHDAAAQPRQPQPLVVKSVPTARSAAPPPQAVAVEHSSSFLLRNRQRLGSEAEGGEQPQGIPQRQQQAAAEEPFQGSAVEWVLKKADQSLDEIEDNPPEYAKVIYDISTGPIGKAASVGLTTAAQVTVQVGTEALKAAVPVGKWALQQGFKLAVGAVRQGMAASSKRDEKKK